MNTSERIYDLIEKEREIKENRKKLIQSWCGTFTLDFLIQNTKYVVDSRGFVFFNKSFLKKCKVKEDFWITHLDLKTFNIYENYKDCGIGRGISYNNKFHINNLSYKSWQDIKTAILQIKKVFFNIYNEDLDLIIKVHQDSIKKLKKELSLIGQQRVFFCPHCGKSVKNDNKNCKYCKKKMR